MNVNVAEEVWGPGFVGFIICLALYGVTLTQTGYYYKTYQKDPKYLKILVASLFVLDTFHVICLSRGFWGILIKGRIDVSMVLVLSWDVLASVIVTYFVTFVVQSFFGYRVWQLGKNWFMTGIIAITALMQLGSGMAFGAHEIITKASGAIFDTQAGSVELISSVICDIAITGSMVYYFNRSRTGVQNTDVMLQKLINVTVNMGLLGCIAAFIGLVLFYQTRGTFLCVAAHFVLSKCYVNSLMASLNARKGIRKWAKQDIHFSLSTFPDGGPSASDSEGSKSSHVESRSAI